VAQAAHWFKVALFFNPDFAVELFWTNR
jgi:hypothetical protein